MKRMMSRQRMPAISELLDIAREGGVRLIACATTMGVMGVKREDLIEGTELGGAAAFLEYASEASVSLFV